MTRFPPLYDYYHWLFQARVLRDMLLGDAFHVHLMREAYSVQLSPVPNLAATLGIALLSVVLRIDLAGRLFAWFAVLAVASGQAFLARTVSKRSSPAEFLGLPFACGYFLYKGYLSYLVGLGLALWVIALLPRGDEPLARRRLRVLHALGIATYFAHVCGSVLVGLATLAHALARLRDRRPRQALELLGTLLTPLGLFAIYSGLRHTLSSPEWYTSLADKGVSLLSPLCLFLRSDPFPERVPSTLLTLTTLGGLGLALGGWRRRAGPRGPLAWSALLAALVAVGLPLSSIGEMSRPDERFVLPALLLFCAARPAPEAPWRRRLAALIAALVLVAHTVEYRAVGAELHAITSASSRFIGASDRVFSLAIWRGRVGGACASQTLPSLGNPPGKWLGLTRLLDHPAPRANLMDTGLLRTDYPLDTRIHFWTLGLTPARAWVTLPPRYEYVEAEGCPADLAHLEALVANDYAEVASTPWYVLLQRRSSMW